jgi:hypothetical protein
VDIKVEHVVIGRIVDASGGNISDSDATSMAEVKVKPSGKPTRQHDLGVAVKVRQLVIKVRQLVIRSTLLALVMA